MSNERGFALIAALWLVVAMSTVGLQLSLSARHRRLAAANTIEAAQSRAAAVAGIEHARARLEHRLADATLVALNRGRPAAADLWRRPGLLLPDTMDFDEGGGRYVVSLRDVGARLNLNRATEEELRRFFRALRVDFGRADRLAQAIMDWRDADDAHRPRGAEREDYLRAETPVLPRNGPFQDVGELRFVQGMDDELFNRTHPYLTLLGTGRINLNTAEPEVLQALEGITQRALAVIMRFRRRGEIIVSLNQVARELPSAARPAWQTNMTRLMSRATFDTREVEVVSEGWIDGGLSRSQVQALFVRGGATVFMVWRRVT